ncbi:hypothetical protein DFP72DRAFT_913766 [Ephemerocybe angulata]|uniref:Uncharacterized protein n=1 Tax=Ephemerocybe angulata TaxID=980116 RepID=A0A8H6HP58_9AGAR|nr:hypothetical protein DFP72DRAFT_913766 [Tulosesus angulatus]
MSSMGYGGSGQPYPPPDHHRHPPHEGGRPLERSLHSDSRRENGASDTEQYNPIQDSPQAYFKSYPIRSHSPSRAMSMPEPGPVHATTVPRRSPRPEQRYTYAGGHSSTNGPPSAFHCAPMQVPTPMPTPMIFPPISGPNPNAAHQGQFGWGFLESGYGGSQPPAPEHLERGRQPPPPMPIPTPTYSPMTERSYYMGYPDGVAYPTESARPRSMTMPQMPPTPVTPYSPYGSSLYSDQNPYPPFMRADNQPAFRLLPQNFE